MRAPRTWSVAVLALVLLAAGFARAAEKSAARPAAAPDITKEARGVIQKMLQAYSSKKQYHATFTLTRSVQVDKRKGQDTYTGTVMVAQPDEVRVKLASGGQSYTVVCDGKQCIAYLSATGKYMQWKASQNMDRVLGDPELVERLQDMARVTLIPFSSNPSKNFMIGVSAASVAPSQKGKDIHLKLDVATGALDVFLDPKTYLVTEAHLLPTRVIEAVKAQHPEFGTVKLSVDLKQTTAPSSEPLPADAFSVKPPKGAVEAASLKDLKQMPALKKVVNFELPSLTKGKTVKLADHKGKVILLDFWATWCPPCRAELPVLQGIYKDYADKGFVLLAVNQGEDRQTVQAFLEQQKLDIPVVLDADGKTGEVYGVQYLPTVYLIAKDGKVLQHLEGYGPGREDELRKAITKALAAPEPKTKG